MFQIVMILFCLVAAIAVPKLMPKTIRKRNGYDDVQEISIAWIHWIVRGSFIALAFIFFLMTSCVIIDSDKTGHLTRIYMGGQMPQGRIIAAPDQKGPQARILGPGFHVIPFIRVTHDIEELPILTVNEGTYAYVVAKDGNPMPSDQFIAPGWDNANDMIDAMKFMGYDQEGDNGPKGVKGPQLTVLPPGDYRVNRYLFDFFEGAARDVPIGHVAVIKSNVGQHYTGDPILPTGVETTTLSVPIVPKGYKGVWSSVLKPDRYYLNEKAYDVTIIPTQIQTWKYLGGYTRRYIDLKLTAEGKIEQSPRKEDVVEPDDAADGAVLLRVENWDVFQDARIQIQVTPENAPFVVAAAGGLVQIEDKIMTPTFRSVLRNEAAKNVQDTRTVMKKNEKGEYEDVEETYMRPRRVLDLLYKREGLETTVETKLIPEGAKYGLTVMEVRFGDPVVPPELLLPGKRKQLAESLISTYKQEKLAQIERVESEKERARADQQGDLMKSEIGIKVANNNAEAREKEGLGEKKYMEALAKGQEAQANVLGKDRTFELAYIKEVLAAVSKNPDLIKVPDVLVMGSESSLEGAAAILGASNLSMSVANQAEKK